MHDEIAKTGGDTSSIDIILKKFEKHLKLANKNEKYASANSFEERCRHGLHEIFGFYCKQLRLLGNTPTFESIERNNETLNLGKFFKFLRDFDIMDTQRRPDKKVLTRKLVQKLYLKITDFRDEMDENQFLKTIELISEFYYDVEYDNINGTNHKSLAPNEKLLKFYMDIGCHDPNIYLKNCKGVIHSFGVAPSRIPIDDLSRNYKFKPEKYKMQRKSVEE